jgi:hypothetical protein
MEVVRSFEDVFSTSLMNLFNTYGDQMQFLAAIPSFIGQISINVYIRICLNVKHRFVVRFREISVFESI